MQEDILNVYNLKYTCTEGCMTLSCQTVNGRESRGTHDHLLSDSKL
jgi:hypothetical protein